MNTNMETSILTHMFIMIQDNYYRYEYPKYINTSKNQLNVFMDCRVDL
jgi:hypothetical protein